MAITVQVKPDLSAFVAATESEVAAIICGRTATRAAAELCRRYVLLPKPDTEASS